GAVAKKARHEKITQARDAGAGRWRGGKCLQRADVQHGELICRKRTADEYAVYRLRAQTRRRVIEAWGVRAKHKVLDHDRPPILRNMQLLAQLAGVECTAVGGQAEHRDFPAAEQGARFEMYLRLQTGMRARKDDRFLRKPFEAATGRYPQVIVLLLRATVFPGAVDTTGARCRTQYAGA